MSSTVSRTPPPAPPPRPRPEEAKPAPAKAKPATIPDRVERGGVPPAERERVRNAYAAHKETTTGEVAQAKAAAPAPKDSPSVKAALGAQKDMKAAEKKLADVVKKEEKGPAVNVAKKDVAVAKAQADKLTNKALHEAKEPAQKALTESSAAQKQATQANARVDEARAHLAGLERNDKAPVKQVDAARDALVEAQRDARQANNRATREGEQAIEAQQEANRVASRLGRPAPYPAAEGITGMHDAAKLPVDTQAKLLGAPAGVNEAQAKEARVDRKAVKAAELEDKAASATRDAERAVSEHEGNLAKLDAAKAHIADLNGKNVFSGPQRKHAQEQLTQAEMDVQRSAPAAHRAVENAERLRGQAHDAKVDANLAAHDARMAEPFPPKAPTEADIRTIVSDDNPVTRNQKITQGYHDLSNQTASLLGRDNANWLTFGQHASAGAGHGIRGQFNMSGFESFVSGPGGVDKGKIQDALGDGNKKIFQDIAPHFARFNKTFLDDPSWRNNPARAETLMKKFEAGFPKDTPPQMKEAFRDYEKAMLLNAGPQTDATRRERAQLMFAANTRIASVEQHIADAEIDRAIPKGNKAGDAGAWVTGRGSVEEAATDKIFLQIGGEKIYVSRDMKHDIPKDLSTVDDRWVRSQMERWNDGKSVNDRSYSDANNWRDEGERMGFISHFFRAYQQGVPEIWRAPTGVKPTEF